MINPRILPILLFVSLTASAQPASEIYLFDLSIKKKSVSAEKPINITKHKGYDNQPSFHPELARIYYSSFNDDGRSDIRVYDYATNTTASITQTPEREYSPTVTPDRDHLSCIIQRDNNAQDLGKYPIEGGTPSVIIDNLVVGYHVWADNSHLALFVLGTPNTLHYVLLPMKKDTILAENIGRSLHRVPGEPAISFVHKISEQEWVIKKFNTHTKQITTVATTLPGRDDLCWLPDGRILMSDGSALFYLKPGPGATWQKMEVADGGILKGVARLAVSPNGKKLAVVVAEE